MRAWAFFTAVMLALGSVLLFPGLEWAQQSTSQYVTMTWSFKNSHPNIVYLQLYAQYKNYVWPGPDKYYKLVDSSAHEARIKCWEGEKICYGAWTDGNSEWGVGRNNKRTCQDCCVVCRSGDQGTRNLTPRK
jgi:hypothetical protein